MVGAYSLEGCDHLPRQDLCVGGCRDAVAARSGETNCVTFGQLPSSFEADVPPRYEEMKKRATCNAA